MKKSTTIITIVLMFLIVGVVACYAFLANRAKKEASEAVMTPVQSALSRDLKKDYPGTVREVIKYYTEIERCFYNEDCTEEEIEQLGMKARELYDDELLANNEVGLYLTQLKSDIKEFKKTNQRIYSIAVASSTNVDFFSEDGYDFARIYCGYVVKDNGQSIAEGRVYLLRRNENRQWKIYGWENSNNVNPGEN